jgi:hypothetical protein
VSEETEIARRKMRNGSGMRNGEGHTTVHWIAPKIMGAPIYVFKDLVGLGQSHLALDQSQVVLTSYSKSDGALVNFTTSRKI